MIDFEHGELSDLWRDNKEPEFLAISYALKLAIIRLLSQNATSQVYSDIDNLQEDALDELAIEMRVQYYNQGLPIDRKREAVKNTLLWHSRAGTDSATRELVDKILGSEDSLIEWYQNGGPVNTFTIETGTVITPDMIEQLNNMIERVKNVRSWLRAVKGVKKTEGQAYIGSLLAENRRYIQNESPHLKYELNGEQQIGSGIGLIRRVTIAEGAYIQNAMACQVYGSGCLQVSRTHFIIQ